MRRNKHPVSAALIAALGIASCSHTTVAGNNACPSTCPLPVTPAPAPSVPSYWQQQLVRDSNTGIVGAVGTPAAGSFGASPAPAQIATADHPKFEQDPIGTTFPVLASSLQAGPGGLTAVPTTQGATATLSVLADPLYQGGLPLEAIKLEIPSIGLNAQWSVADIQGVGDDFGTIGGNYVVLGSWETRGGASTGIPPLQNVSWFTFGFETPTAAMPATGQASFTGLVEGDVFAPAGGQILEGQLLGRATFSVDFSSGKLTGAFTNNQANGTVWNDVSVGSSIATGSNRFSGTAAVTSAPPGQFSLGASAAGSINGAFYGPAAQELGAIWTLSDGTRSALGGVVAGH